VVGYATCLTPLPFRCLAVGFVGILLVGSLAAPLLPPRDPASGTPGSLANVPALPTNDSAVGNFTASIDRMVELLALAGGGILALVWARVALSWFSNDVAKKVQAKDRARDALIGSLLFTAAITGLIWGLAHWVLTGS
jgi:hypothetical protein